MSKKKRQINLKEKELSNREVRNKYIRELASCDNNDPLVFSSIVKNFFKDFLKIKYEVTFEELVELTLRKKLQSELMGEIAKLLTELSEFEFKTDTKNFDIGYFKFNFERILNKLTSGRELITVTKENKKLMSWLLKLPSLLFAKRKKQPIAMGELLEACRKHIFEKNLVSAKEYYLLAIEKYNTVSDDEKHIFYESLKDIREQLMNK